MAFPDPPPPRLDDSYRERVRQMVDDATARSGMSRTELALALDMSDDWLGTVIRGDSKSPQALPLTRLCEWLGYSIRWVMTGRGPMQVDLEQDDRWAREHLAAVGPAPMHKMLAGAFAPVTPRLPAAPKPPPPASKKKRA